VGDAMVVSYANKLLLNAAKDYWTWYEAEREFGYLKNGVLLAKQRFDGVREQVKVGEEAGIDSVEAKILYQDRLNQLKTAQLEKRNAFLKLSTYLWEVGYNAMKVDTAEGAPLFEFTSLPDGFFDETYAEQVRTKNPELMITRGEIEQLKVDRRLAIEMLKPEIDLKYQVLSKDRYSGIDNGAFYVNNYRYGATVAMPLLLRKERGKLGQLKAKIIQQELDLKQAERNAQNVWETTKNELILLREQIVRQQDMVRNYELLREAEVIKFTLGESSLFLVNTRENKLLEAQIKLASLEQKWQKARAMAFNLTGQLLAQ
jgi:outer membrane protein TolC